jgi:uncharacterized YccA/Bax inhibitor family protein
MKDIRIVAVAVILAIGVSLGLLVLAWSGMQRVGPDAARAWALIATLLLIVGLPLAVLVGMKYGHAESKGAMVGLDLGVSKVQQAANQAASLGFTAMRTTREIVREQPQAPVFSLPPIEPARQITPGDVVEM